MYAYIQRHAYMLQEASMALPIYSIAHSFFQLNSVYSRFLKCLFCPRNVLNHEEGIQRWLKCGLLTWFHPRPGCRAYFSRILFRLVQHNPLSQHFGDMVSICADWWSGTSSSVLPSHFQTLSLLRKMRVAGITSLDPHAPLISPWGNHQEQAPLLWHSSSLVSSTSIQREEGLTWHLEYFPVSPLWHFSCTPCSAISMVPVVFPSWS